MDRNKLKSISQHAKKVDFWTIKVCYFFSFRLVVLVEQTFITPDFLTWSSIFLCLSGAALLFLYPGNYWWQLTAGLLFHLSYILDCADGQLARYKQQFSENGWRLDLYSDRIKEYLILLSMTYALTSYRNVGLLAGMTAMAVLSLQKYLRVQEVLNSTLINVKSRRKTTLNATKIYRRKVRLGRIKQVKEKYNLGLMNIGEFYFLNLVFIIAGRFEWFFYTIIIYGLFSIWYYLALNINNERFFHLHINRFFHDEKKLIVFGTGSGGRNILFNLLNQGIEVAYLCDNDKSKWGTSLLGLPVKNPEVLRQDKEKVNVIIASAWHQEIYDQLKLFGFEDEQLLVAYG